jgi:hypothetical protein
MNLPKLHDREILIIRKALDTYAVALASVAARAARSPGSVSSTRRDRRVQRLLTKRGRQVAKLIARFANTANYRTWKAIT